MLNEKIYVLIEGRYSEKFGEGEIQIALKAENALKAIKKMEKVLDEKLTN